jgi:nucleotide-binding universal stress UspA family protein
MSKIVCAIRGGPYSQATINKAISLAKETGLQITFLYIVNLDFLARSTSLRTHTINKEMEEMGEFILLTACSQAAEKGVSAVSVVRHGQVGEEIVKLCNELGARYLVIGHPQLDEDERNVFSHTRLTNFAGLVEEQTGAVVVMPEE